MDKKILITGGAGYIGSKITYDLIDQGFKIFIIDNLSTGNKKLICPKAKFYFGDILDYNFIDKLLFKNNIKNIIHLAACLDVNESEKNPQKYYLNNTEATNILLKAACKNNLENFIFSSTSAVYGEIENNRPAKEDDYCSPKSHYGKSKLLCEYLIKNYSSKFKFNYGILRYFNVAGADEKLRTGSYKKSDQLFNNLTRICINEQKPKVCIYGKNYNTADGTCIRDYIDVSDLSKIHIVCLKKISKKKISKILNCGYGKGYSVLEIVRIFEKILKKKIKIKYEKKRKVDVESIVSNIKKFNNFFKKDKLILSKSLNKMVYSSLQWRKKLTSTLVESEIF